MTEIDVCEYNAREGAKFALDGLLLARRVSSIVFTLTIVAPLWVCANFPKGIANAFPNGS